MTFKIEIRGMSFFYADDGSRKYRTLAMAEVYLPDLAMTLRDVRLVWSPDRGYVAHAPASTKAASQPMIQWYHRSEFARDLTEKLRDMFERMGGRLPRPKPIEVEIPAALEWPIGEEAPIERRTFPATFIVHEEEANDNEAVEGLHRMLGIVREEAERACG